MAYIAPNSEIYLYENIEFDNSYKDTMWFDSEADQIAYFTTTKQYKYGFTSQQYTRASKGKIRVHKKADYLYDINYMKFRNTRVTNGRDKWFYAFITEIEYINEEVSELTFEIDVMQTYLFDVTIENSFVIRQHSVTDGMFEYTMLEDLNCGDDYLVVNGADISAGENGNASNSVYKKVPDKMLVMHSKVIGPGLLWDDTYTPAASIINNLPCLLAIKTYTMDQNGMNQYMSFIQGSSVGPNIDPNDLITAFCFPSELEDLIPAGAKANTGPSTQLSLTSSTPNKYTPANPPAMPLNFNGYVPHNYKMYCYPYNFMLLSNCQGDTKEYKYELFMTNNGMPTMIFAIRGVVLPEPLYQCIPLNYRGLTLDYDSSVQLSNYPTIPLTRDGFTSWWNQNRQGLALNLIGETVGKYALASALLPEMSSNVNMLLGSHALTAITRSLGKYANATATPNRVAGNYAGSGIMAGTNRYQFVFQQLQVKPEYAKAIDTYFDMFGYKMNRVMAVNRSARPLWNYTKTAGCSVHNRHLDTPNDGADSTVLKTIENIYDNGITFWKNVAGLNVGDYSRAAENSLHYTP